MHFSSSFFQIMIGSFLFNISGICFCRAIPLASSDSNTNLVINRQQTYTIDAAGNQRVLDKVHTEENYSNIVYSNKFEKVVPKEREASSHPKMRSDNAHPKQRPMQVQEESFISTNTKHYNSASKVDKKGGEMGDQKKTTLQKEEHDHRHRSHRQKITKSVQRLADSLIETLRQKIQKMKVKGLGEGVMGKVKTALICLGIFLVLFGIVKATTSRAFNYLRLRCLVNIRSNDFF